MTDEGLKVFKVRFTRTMTEEGYGLISAKDELEALQKAEQLAMEGDQEYRDIVDSDLTQTIDDQFPARRIDPAKDGKNIAWYEPKFGTVLGVDPEGTDTIHSYRVARPEDMEGAQS